MMELKIRPAKEEDFNSVFILLEQLWLDEKLDYKTLQDVFQSGLDSNTQKLIIGILDDKIIGFCSLSIKNSLWQAGKMGHIDELIVDKIYRKNGFGKKLISAIDKIAKELKCKRIELDTALHRKEAHEFYELIGYENRALLYSKKIDQ